MTKRQAELKATPPTSPSENTPTIIILFGPAGSGKSLQGQLLAEKYGWRWLSVGQILRDQNDPDINEKLKGGELFDDEFVTKLMHKAIKQVTADGQNVILDGYPRDAWQTQWIIDNGGTANISGAIVFKVPAKELWKRIANRSRHDDTKNVVKRRWEIFEQNICSILPLLKSQKVKVTTLNGVGEIPEITTRIETQLKNWGILNLTEPLDQDEDRDNERSYGE